MRLQRGTAPTRASPLAQGRWAASTALKTVSPTIATGDSPCVAPSSGHARKGALGVEQSLLAKVTLDPHPQVQILPFHPHVPIPAHCLFPLMQPSSFLTSKPARRTSSLLSPSCPVNPPSPVSGQCVFDPPPVAPPTFELISALSQIPLCMTPLKR